MWINWCESFDARGTIGIFYSTLEFEYEVKCLIIAYLLSFKYFLHKKKVSCNRKTAKFLSNMNLKSFSEFCSFQTLHGSLAYPQLGKKFTETVLPFLCLWFTYVYNENLFSFWVFKICICVHNFIQSFFYPKSRNIRECWDIPVENHGSK